MKNIIYFLLHSINNHLSFATRSLKSWSLKSVELYMQGTLLQKLDANLENISTIVPYCVPVPIEEVNVHLYCPVCESSLQEYVLCFLSLSAEESHGGISSFLGRNLLDVVDVLDFVSLLIINTLEHKHINT